MLTDKVPVWTGEYGEMIQYVSPFHYNVVAYQFLNILLVLDRNQIAAGRYASNTQPWPHEKALLNLKINANIYNFTISLRNIL